MASPEDVDGDIVSPGGPLRQDRFSREATAALEEALNQARLTHWDSVRSPHIFMGLLSLPDESLKRWVQRLGADPAYFVSQFQELFLQDGQAGDNKLMLHREFLSDRTIELLREAWRRAQQQRRDFVTPMDLLISLLSAPRSVVVECFERIGLSAVKLTEMAVLAENQLPPD